MCDALVFLIVMIIRLGYMYILPAMYSRVETSNLSKGHDGKLFDDSGKMIKGPDFVRVDFQCMWSRSLLIAPTLYEAIIADHPDGLEGMTFRPTNSSWVRVSSASPHPPPYHTLVHHYPEHQALYPI